MTRRRTDVRNEDKEENGYKEEEETRMGNLLGGQVRLANLGQNSLQGGLCPLEYSIFLADFAEDKLTFLHRFNLFLTNSFSVTVKLTISTMSKVTCKTEVWATSNL